MLTSRAVLHRSPPSPWDGGRLRDASDLEPGGLRFEAYNTVDPLRKGSEQFKKIGVSATCCSHPAFHSANISMGERRPHVLSCFPCTDFPFNQPSPRFNTSTNRLEPPDPDRFGWNSGVNEVGLSIGFDHGPSPNGIVH